MGWGGQGREWNNEMPQGKGLDSERKFHAEETAKTQSLRWERPWYAEQLGCLSLSGLHQLSSCQGLSELEGAGCYLMGAGLVEGASLDARYLALISQPFCLLPLVRQGSKMPLIRQVLLFDRK